MKNKFSLHGGASLVAADSVDECAIGKNDMVGEFDSDIEEGVGASCYAAIYLILTQVHQVHMLVHA